MIIGVSVAIVVIVCVLIVLTIWLVKRKKGYFAVGNDKDNKEVNVAYRGDSNEHKNEEKKS